MTNRHLLLPTPGGIGPGQTANLELPLGPTYERLDIELNVDVAGVATDVAAADWATYVDDIRLVVDGSTQIEIRAVDLVKLNQFYDLSMEPGVLPLHLSAPWARTIGGEDMGSYGTAGGIQSLTLEIDLKDGISINKLRVRYVQGETKPYGPHTVIRRMADSSTTTGVVEIADITKGPYNMLGIHITDADIGHVQIEADNMILVDTEAKSRRQQFRVSGRNPQIGMTHLDFVGKNRVAFVDMGSGTVRAEALPMSFQDFRLKLDFENAPGPFDIYQHSIQGR